jgi:putative ABC transport system permease protein
MAVTPANFRDWATRVETLDDVAGAYAIDASFTGVGVPERVSGGKVTARFFDAFGVPPALGRTFAATDFSSADRVVVLGHALWTRQFNRSTRVIGTTVHIDGDIYTVIGVMPRTFRTVGNGEIWIPWVMSPDEQRERRFHLVSTIARLRDGRSTAEAESELATIYRRLEAEYPQTTSQWSARVLPFRDLLLGDSARALMALGGAVLVLVVVAWMNVASLLLAWLPSRRHELLVRMAVGASMTRIVRQLLLETLVWAGAGMIAGLAMATWFIDLFGAVGISTALPFDFAPRVDARIIVAAGLLLLFSVALTAIGPCVLAVHHSSDLVPRRSTATSRFGRGMVVAVQIALSTVLLCAAAALLVAFRHLGTIASPALVDGPTMAIEVARPETGQADEVSDRLFFERLLVALGNRGEIRAIGAASYVPPTNPLGNVRFAIRGRATSTDAQTALASAVNASAFRVLGISLLSGRLIEERDSEKAPVVAVISASLAKRYWADDNPLGQEISIVGADPPVTIVGVVGDVRQPLSKDPRAESVVYLSYRQFPWPFMTLVFAPATNTTDAVAAVRQEIARLDPTQAAGSMRALDEIRTEWLLQPRLQTTVVTLFGLATLFLTVTGLYARIAHSVAIRTREFAIRQALGARPADVVRHVTRESLVIVAGGLVIGLALLPIAMRMLRSLVLDASSLDGALGAAVISLLGITALVSAYWPARRAGRIDAVLLLKAEQ